MERDVFANISPLDHRYSTGFPDLYSLLSSILSEKAYIRYQCMVEAALTRTLARRGICSEETGRHVERACSEVTPDEVYEEEKRTRHNIRALVNCIRRRIPEESRPYVHFGATSVDILDTARALQYKEAASRAVVPELLGLLRIWLDLTRREAGTVQIGRTHGQHAVPVTFGFALAEYVSRLGGRIERIKHTAADLRGKLAGAVGAYNATSLFLEDPDQFEKEVLGELGLRPATHSTQIVEAEYVLDFVHALISTFGVLASFADDIRHLQRTEIGEVAEAFASEQVGSSTMPHKRNPWNFEHVKSMWKEFVPRINTVYMDQISEHQRDLTNSASGRFVPEIIAGLTLCCRRLSEVCARLMVDRKRMGRNLEMTEGMIAAEPLYILLAACGHPDAHERVRQLTLSAEATGHSLSEEAESAEDLRPYLEKMTCEQRAIIHDPRKYTGIAARKALSVCDFWQEKLGIDADG